MVRLEPEAEPDAELDTTKPGNSKYSTNWCVHTIGEVLQ
jgi:hypothetical protein